MTQTVPATAAGAPSSSLARHDDPGAARRRSAELRLARYFASFGLRDPRQLDRLTADVLARVPARRASDDLAAAALTAAEARVAAWFARVLDRGNEGGDDPDALVLAGRAAFLLCDGPEAWPDAFLRDPPPGAFVAAMRRAAVDPVPAPEPCVMPAQELAFWSPADLLPPRLFRPAHAVSGLLLGLMHWR